MTTGGFATTIHRLLKFDPAKGGFTANEHTPLATDFLVVDEASMVDLELMARVLSALPTQARVILLGDPDQLASVQAGAVLAQLCEADWLKEQRVNLRHSHRFQHDRGIGQWALDKGIWVVTDEIYEHLVYGDAEFTSMPAVVPEIADRCVIVNGVAKTYAMTGWRVGWMIGPKDVMKAAINFQSHTTSNVSNVAQMAALEAVSGDLSAVAMMRESFARRGALMHKLLSDIPGVTCMEPQGAFYCFPNVKGLLGRNLSGSTATTTLELADLVLDKAKVAFVPGEAFGAPGFARFSFALGDDDLRQGIEQLASYVQG